MSESPATETVLVVDDAPDSIEILNQILQGKYRVLFATSGPQGLTIAKGQRPDIILLDVGMAGMDGYQVCRELKSDPDTRDIPVIFVTGRDQDDDQELGFRIGAADYLTKPVRPALVRIRVRNQLQLRRSEGLIRQRALYDSLTNLPNRSLIMDRLSFSLNHGRREQKKTALLFIDLDNFKKVNDTLGHDAGDLLLIEVAGLLRRCVREGDTVGRLGGDEFVVILSGIIQMNDVRRVAKSILSGFARPLLVSGMELVTTVSIGIAIGPDNGTDCSALLRNADTAMYQSKNAGKNGFHIFNKKKNEGARRHMRMEHHLHAALDRGELAVCYQPIMDIGTRITAGAEALLRWNNPELGTVVPNEFIGLAEHSGLIESIGAFVLEQGCRQFRDLVDRNGQPLSLAVNISPQQFRRADLPKLVAGVLKETGFAPERLELEVTEGLLLGNQSGIKEALHALRGMGVRLSMDDFGTGYSSLSYLHQFSFDIIKIDRSFVAGLGRSPEDEALVKASIAMAQAFGLTVIAEGVEKEAQLALLADKGCDQAQGYLFSQPVPYEDFVELLEKVRA